MSLRKAWPWPEQMSPVVARRFERLQEVARQLEQAFGVRAHAIQADLRDEVQIDAALQQAQETLALIDIQVNNAGIAPVSRAERHALDRWQQALDINLTAVFLCCQKVGQQMIIRGQGGWIINISFWCWAKGPMRSTKPLPMPPPKGP